jgi:5-methyltetrahydropteroyltriglutamate--homocysteine methyltransferase
MMGSVISQTFGFPRIGRDRELKRALEAYWKGSVDQTELISVQRQVITQGLQAQRKAGIDRIGIGDATLYDHVLDWAVRTGLIAGRFQELEGLDQYFAMARGVTGIHPLDLTKWFNTNYHYLVPEIEVGTHPRANFDNFVDDLEFARKIAGDQSTPIILGPVTLLTLSRLGRPIEDVLNELISVYEDLLKQLDQAGFSEVQIHEPALVFAPSAEQEHLYRAAYERFGSVGPQINLVTYFDDLGDAFTWVVDLPVDIISLDFTRGDNLGLINTHGWPSEKTLGIGLVDARNIWRISTQDSRELISALAEVKNFRVGPSSSLQFVPYLAAREDQLPTPLQNVLAFAEEKLEEIELIKNIVEGKPVEKMIDEAEGAWATYREAVTRSASLSERLENLSAADFRRETPFSERRSSQIHLPLFPTTTIGSFPQTKEIRRLRGQFKRGELDQDQYEAAIDSWIAYTIGTQEGLGLDVLVHGEFERSDMVEYFAQKLEGFAFTQNGWVQSYGNRYVRPPIIWSDVLRPDAMTVREFAKAQSYTEKPVKGMLTGPVTILNWSFPRKDVSRKDIAFQIGLALRDEIIDLEAAGARVIQVDEPALREGLPLKPGRWDEYLSWAVDSFLLATGGAESSTQIHTHMCYSEFDEVMDSIDRLDADVMLIENTRSSDATLQSLSNYGYDREIGPGIYDVHSSVVPDSDEIKSRLLAFSDHLRAEQIWVNPDCGLKTRTWNDILPSLTNLVEAAKEVREQIGHREEILG